jgi:hypothetical protein
MANSRLWNRYIINTFPLPHIVILIVLVTVVLRIAFSFHFHYEARPLLTICVVASLLGAISDTLAQMIELIRSRQRVLAAKPKTQVVSEIELEEKPSPSLPPGTSPAFNWSSSERPVFYDFPRVIRFMGFGFFFSPISVQSISHSS